MTQSPSSDQSASTAGPNADPRFVAAYRVKSLSSGTRARFRAVHDKLMAMAQLHGHPARGMDVLDVGCGAGTQCQLWAQQGHRVCGVDISRPLIDTARARAAEAGLAIRFEVGSATQLPFADASHDVCLLPQLLEHVPDWEGCLREAVRVLRPRGLLYVSTSNVLCPRQAEFNLPLYSWYPRPLKRHYERLALTTRPDLANHASYPAIHWFTYRRLARYLEGLGMQCYDRFDLLDWGRMRGWRRAAAGALQALPALKLPAQMFVRTSMVFAVKR